MDEQMLKLQNGSDIRGVALEGVEGENVNLTPSIANRIGQAFAQWLSAKTKKKHGSVESWNRNGFKNFRPKPYDCCERRFDYKRR